MDTRATKIREDGLRVARQGAVGPVIRQGAVGPVARQGALGPVARQGAVGSVVRQDKEEADRCEAEPIGCEDAASANVQRVSRIERLCIDRGLKMTGQRRLIARVLSDSADHPDVEELYRRAVTQDSRISIATVYRTVRLLEEKGILERRDFGGNRARYDQADRGHHYHLIDIETGKVIEFADPRHEILAREIAERLGFELVEHRLELFGRRLDPAADGRGRPPAEPANHEAGSRDAG